jgi:hypothetical protein
MIVYSIRAFTSISIYGPSFVSNLFNKRYSADSFLWSYDALIFNNVVFLVVSILITWNTKNKIVKSTPGMKEGLRRTKYFALINFINHIIFSVFLGIGSSLYYLSTLRSVNGVDLETGIIIIIITSIMQLASIFILFRLPSPLLSKIGIEHTKSVTNEVKKQNKQNILIFLASLLKIASYIIVISTVILAFDAISSLYSAYIYNNINELFTRRNINYEIAFSGSIIYIFLIIIARKITDENVRRGLKKSVKRTVIFQTFNMTIFNIYLILGTLLIENYRIFNQMSYRFTLLEAIISAVIYYGYIMLILVLNWKLVKVSKVEKKKIRKLRWLIIIVGILLGLYLIYMSLFTLRITL